MNIKLLPFVNALQALKLPVQDRQKVAAIAIGYAAACHAALPSSEVAEAQDYFRTTHAPAIRQVVSYFNEGVVIDTRAAEEFARNFWTMRYEAVHRCPRMDQIPGDFFGSVFGAAKFFSEDTRKFCDANARDIQDVYLVACGRITEMLQCEKKDFEDTHAYV